jgi:hypothetical protein
MSLTIFKHVPHSEAERWKAHGWIDHGNAAGHHGYWSRWMEAGPDNPEGTPPPRRDCNPEGVKPEGCK